MLFCGRVFVRACVRACVYVFNLKTLQAKTKVQRGMTDEFRCADNTTKMPQQRKKCKKVWIEFHMLLITVFSTISTKRAEAVHQPVPGKP